MAETIEALVCQKLNGDYELKRLTLGDMREDELVVRMVATGICHTDFACINVAYPAPRPTTILHLQPCPWQTRPFGVSGWSLIGRARDSYRYPCRLLAVTKGPESWNGSALT